jgi:uncharacterized oxidoreductase
MKLSGNKILITGGASGIGLGFTERFVKEGNTVIICGRRESILKEVAGKHPGVIIKVCDLSSEMSREELYQWVSVEHSDLNVLVNNAGIQNWMNITDTDFFKRAKAEIATNIEAPIHLMSLFAGMKSLDTIINVTSGLAYIPFSKIPVYSATKAFFHSFTVSARLLLQPRNIEVIDVIPPALDTDLGGKGIHDGHPPVSEFIEGVFEQLAAGETEITYGFSVKMANSSADEIKVAFNRMNGVEA